MATVSPDTATLERARCESRQAKLVFLRFRNKLRV
jgi:hypothetical protein